MKAIKLAFISAILLSGINSMADQSVDILVTKKGFEPSKFEVKAGEKVTLNITRKVKATCAKQITVPDEGIKKDLPINKKVTVEFTPKKQGELVFGCAMNQMIGGTIVVN